MPVVVVSRVPSLATALASRLHAVGIEPDDLAAYLETTDRLDGAVIDCTSTDLTMQAAQAVRLHDPWCPIVLLLTGDNLPDRDLTDPLEPVRLVRRPFTTATVVDHMISMQRSGPPRPTSSSLSSPAHSTGSAQDAGTLEPEPVTIDDDAGHNRARWGRRQSSQRPLNAAAVSVRDAMRILLKSELPPTVQEAVQRVVDRVAALVTEQTAIAVLVRDAGEWRVEGGRGVRPNEARTPVSASHWLAKHVAGRDTAVVVSGTDVARQELTSVPLIHFEYWMAVTLQASSVMIIVGRSDEPPFNVNDAVALADGVSDILDEVIDAQSLRALADRIEPYL